jgi:hypothetical protein
MLALLELLGSLFDIADIIMLPLDLICFVGDVVCWFKGKPNRQARKAAKREGEDPPARNNWNKGFIVCTILVAAATLYLFISRFLRT